MRRSTFTVLAVLLLASLSCGRSASSSRAMVLIVIDTLRADRLGSYGYPTASTPTLDALAARGVRFSRAMTPVPITLPAVTSLLTGRYPFHHGVRDNERYVAGPGELTLAERFREAGWRTAAVLGSAILSADRGLDQGFENYDDRFTGPYATYDPSLRVFASEFAADRRRADVVTDHALTAARGFNGEPYFLFVHYFDVHSYYDPPPPFAALHKSRYDGEISFVDAQIGRLLEGLREHGDPVVLVVADHGEGLGEHGEPEHSFLLYESTVHVPMLIAGPGIPEGVVREEPVSLIDIEPTLAAWFDLPGEGPEPDGQRLAFDTPNPADRLLYTETFRPLVSYNWSELRAARQGSRKVIVGPTSEQYDLEADPRELRDLGEDETSRRLTAAIADLTGHETREAVLAELKPDVAEDRREVLESLGYVGAIDERKPDQTYPHPKDELPRWLETQRLRAYYRKGLALAVRGDYAESIAIFDSLLTREPDRADIYYNRATSRRHLGDEAGFRADLDAALRADPNHVLTLVSLANIAVQEGRQEDADRLWHRAHDIDPEHPGPLLGLAEAHARAGEWDAALPYLRTLVNRDPKNANALYNLGFAAQQAGRNEEARNAYRRFLAVAPEDARSEAVRRLIGE